MGVPHRAGAPVERGALRIARAAGAGVVRLVGSLPDRLVVALFCLGLSVSVAVLAEEFRPAVVLPATAVLIVLTWRLTPPAPGPEHTPRSGRWRPSRRPERGSWSTHAMSPNT